MKKIKQFIKTAFIYFLGSVLAKLVSFFLLPLYTSYIAPNQYGTYDLLLSLINLICPLAFFQIWDGMFRYAFDYDEKEEKYSVINHAVISFLIGVPIFIILFIGTQMYFQFAYFGYVLFYGFCFSLQYIYAYAARIFLNNKLFVISGTVNTLSSALINIILIVGYGWDIKSLYFAPAIGCLIQIVIIEWRIGVLRHFSMKNIKFYRIKRMLGFSIPLCFATISYWLLSGFTKVMITKNLGSAENGLYAVANRFASIVTIIITVFQYAWNEMAYMMANDDKRTNSYTICVNLLFTTIIAASGAVCLGIKMIFPFFIGNQYQAALNIIPAVFIGAAVNSMAGLFGTLFMTEKRTLSILTSTLIAAVFNIFTSLIAIKLMFFTLQMAVIILSASFMLLMIIRLWQLKSKFNVRLQLGSLLMCIPLVASIVVYYSVDNIYIYAITIVLEVLVWIAVNKSFIKMFFQSIKRKS